MLWLKWFRLLVFIAVIIVCGITVTQMLAAETPYGRITGTLTSEETKGALAETPISLVSEEDSKIVARTVTDAEGAFIFPRVAPGSYLLLTDTQAHEQPTESIEVRDAETSTLQLALQPTAPFVRLFQAQRIFTTQEEAALRCHGFVKADDITVTIYRIAPEVAIEAWNGWLPGALHIQGYSMQETVLDKIPQLTLVTTLTQSVGKRDREGIFRERLNLGKLPASLYLVDVRAGDTRAREALAVTDIGVVVKGVPDRILAYAVSLITGKPIAGMAIEVRSEKQVVARGVSDARGLLDISLNTSSGGSVQVIGRQGESIAVANLYLYRYNETEKLRVYTFTDRPVYRPGHTVEFKAITRQATGRTSYRVPAGKAAAVRITDGKNNVLYSGNHRTNEFGSYFGSVTLPDSALPGYYSIKSTIDGDEYYGDFVVAEYRKPEFEVRITTPKSRYTRGESFTGEINAQYYFGAPVAFAEVEYTVTRTPDWWYGGDYDSWNADLFSAEESDERYSYGGEGEVVASGTGRTDENGRMVVAVSTEPEPGKQLDDDVQDWRYTLYASVEDVSKRSEEGTRSVRVTQGDFRLNVRTSDYLATPGKKVTVEVDARDYAGKGVAAVRGTAELLRAEWKDNRETLHSEGNFRWQADRNGMAEFSVSPRREGDYRIRVRAEDRRGRRITGNGWLWVMDGDEGDFSYPYQDLDVRADKPIYQAGDTAEIVVNTRHAPVEALLTLEGDTLLEHRMVTLDAKSTVLKIPVKSSYMPNFQVSLCFVRNKQLISGTASINISRQPKALTVEITADKAKYQPGEEATFLVRTTTPDGDPVRAEVSFALVDEAVYAIRQDDLENIVSFFYRRVWSNVQTTFSFPYIYLSGDDKAGSSIQTRRVFPDTAQWSPTLVTDAEGQATVVVTMPDSLTTWRATCRAATMDTRVGQGTAKVLVQKPFLVRLEAPRFLTQGDEAQVSVIAHNLSDRPLSVTMALEGSGVQVRDAKREKFELEQGESRRISGTVLANAVGNAEFRAWGRASGMSEVNFEDAMAITIPVIAKGRREVAVRAGSVPETAALRFPAGTGILPGSRQLTIRLSPSLASAMLGSLEYLARYPYGCTEQTMSCLLPDVVVSEVMKETGTVNAKLTRELPKMVNAGLLRLYGFQQNDGGWGWWETDQSDPWMTAYVVFGLLRARDAGFTVNAQVLEQGIEALARHAVQERKERRGGDEAFMAYTLTLCGRSREASVVLDRYRGVENEKARTSMNNWGRALMALAMHRLGNAAEAQALLEEVWDDFTQGRLMERNQQWEYYAETDHAAALLFAASEMSLGDARLEGLIRWLLERRQGDHWSSTRDTAFTLYGLSRYVRNTGELHPDLTAAVTVNGKTVVTRQFTAADVNKPEYRLTVDPGQESGKPVSVSVRADGVGKLYYSVMLEGVTTANLDKPAHGDSDLQITRSYRKMPKMLRNVRTKAKPAPPQTSFRTGDIIEVTLSIRADRPYEYLLVEDPLPAGCEASDRGYIDPWSWDYWWTNQIVRDKMVAFPIRRFDKGARDITYRVTAMTAGKYTALPAKVYNMYDPGAWADSPAQTITIRD